MAVKILGVVWDQKAACYQRFSCYTSFPAVNNAVGAPEPVDKHSLCPSLPSSFPVLTALLAWWLHPWKCMLRSTSPCWSHHSCCYHGGWIGLVWAATDHCLFWDDTEWANLKSHDARHVSDLCHPPFLQFMLEIILDYLWVGQCR